MFKTVQRVGLIAAALAVLGCGGAADPTPPQPAPPAPLPPPPPPAPSLMRVEILPKVVTLVAGGSQQFTASAVWSDGTTTDPLYTFTATGGNVGIGGLFQAGTSPGAYYVAVSADNDRLSDTAQVTVEEPVIPWRFPAAYDPARLGANLLAGNSWQRIVTAGTADHGWANLTAAVPFAMGSSSGSTNPGMLGVYPDATFGQAVRITNKPGADGMTAQVRNKLAPSQTVWARWTIRLEGSDTAIGFTSSTTTPGESGTYKLAFLFPETHRFRVEWTMMRSGQLRGEGGGGAGFTETPLAATDATTPAPAPSGPFAGIYTGSVPSLGGPYSPSNMLKNRDWYSLTMNVTTVGPTDYMIRYFLHRLTVNGAWDPWPVPVWMGWRVSGRQAENYTDFWITGNKSGAATLEQWMWLGPWEVTNATDPYGWDHYGK